MLHGKKISQLSLMEFVMLYELNIGNAVVVWREIIAVLEVNASLTVHKWKQALQMCITICESLNWSCKSTRRVLVSIHYRLYLFVKMYLWTPKIKLKPSLIFFMGAAWKKFLSKRCFSQSVKFLKHGLNINVALLSCKPWRREQVLHPSITIRVSKS